jgi:hypothetical protein
VLGYGLKKLISKAVHWQLISRAAIDFSNSFRDYRNLVHPGAALRDQLTVAEEEARIAIEILNIVCRDLTARHREKNA